MLETIRRHCRDADPHPVTTEEAHAAWVRQLAAEQNALIHGPVAVQDLRVLTGELANLRAGIVHDLERNPTEALRTTGQLPVLWPSIAATPEGMRLTQAALDAAPGRGPRAPCGWAARALAHDLPLRSVRRGGTAG